MIINRYYVINTFTMLQKKALQELLDRCLEIPRLGIPSRYVTGTVEIPIKKAQAWAGAETLEAAVKVIGSMGITMVAMVSGGVISAVRIEHSWIEAYDPYESYSGKILLLMDCSIIQLISSQVFKHCVKIFTNCLLNT